MDNNAYDGLRSTPFNASKGVRVMEVDGYKVIEGVTLLSEGIWVDSNVGTPLKYSADRLKEFADNWEDNRLWSAHTGGLPRPITQWIGEIKNPRVESKALKGDLWFHMNTQESRDTFELVKAGIEGKIKPTSFSIEHEGTEEYNKALGHFEAKTFTFHGGAIVDIGASAGTKIMEAGEAPGIRYLSRYKTEEDRTLLEGGDDKKVKGDGNIELEEIMAKLEALEQRIADLEGGAPPSELQEGEAPPAEVNKEEVEAVAEAAAEQKVEEVVAEKVEEAKAEIATKVEEVVEEKVAAELAKKTAQLKTLSKHTQPSADMKEIAEVRKDTGGIGG